MEWFTYPDKPVQAGPLILPGLGGQDWLAQFKYDGWRTLIYKDHAGQLHLLSNKRKPIDASPGARQKLAEDLRHLAPDSLLDSEWVARRAGNAQGVERFVVFDLLRWRGTDYTRRGALDRWVELCGLVPAALRVEATREDFAAFFEESKRHPLTEGIVLKRTTSPFLGSCRACRVNPQWLKVKWRAGDDGKTRAA
jgi:ATP-dependent DNA ligase